MKSGHVGTWQSRQARTTSVYSSSIPLPYESAPSGRGARRGILALLASAPLESGRDPVAMRTAGGLASPFAIREGATPRSERTLRVLEPTRPLQRPDSASLSPRGRKFGSNLYWSGVPLPSPRELYREAQNVKRFPRPASTLDGGGCCGTCTVVMAVVGEGLQH